MRGSRKANRVGITIITFESTMEKITKDEQSSIIGGCQAEIDLLVANANANGADWTDEQWDEWQENTKPLVHINVIACVLP